MNTPLEFYDARTTAMLDDMRDLDERYHRIYADSFGDKVHHIATGITKTNAESIVHACNSHAELPEIIEQLESCNFECEAGPLELNMAFIRLKFIAKAKE